METTMTPAQSDLSNFGISPNTETAQNDQEPKEEASQAENPDQEKAETAHQSLKKELENDDYIPGRDGHFPGVSPADICRYYNDIKFNGRLGKTPLPIGRLEVILNPAKLEHSPDPNMDEEWDQTPGVYLKYNSAKYSSPPDPIAVSDNLLSFLAKKLLIVADETIDPNETLLSVGSGGIGNGATIRTDSSSRGQEVVFSSINLSATTIPSNPAENDWYHGFCQVRKLGKTTKVYNLAPTPRLQLEEVISDTDIDL